MTRPIQVAVIGGGSTYTPELVEGFIENFAEAPVKRLALMDIDEQKLGIVGALARRMVSASGLDFSIVLTTRREEALEGADFIITQIRVGGMAARILDEKIPLQYGVIGQETTGPGGFAKALRTIPVILNLAADVERLAPQAVLINFTNPAGLITEALHTHSQVNSIGLCNLPIGAEMRLAKSLGVERRRLSLDWVGLNHLNWIRGAWLDGQDIFAEVFKNEIDSARQSEEDDWGFSDQLLETLGMIPCGYLNYFYNHPRVLEHQRTSLKTRGEEVAEIEAGLLEMYSDEDLKEKPALLEQRGGAYYSKAAVSLITAMLNNKGEIHIVNTRNNGTVQDLPRDCVVEMPSSIGAGGARPLASRPLPVSIRGLIEAVKTYEQLTVKAAVEGDRRAAIQALLAHPLVPSFSAAQGLVDALLQAHSRYLPQFFPKG